MDDETVAIGRRIKAWRERAGKKQNRVALAAMLPTDVLCKIESGVRRVDAAEMRRIADALKVSVEDFYRDPPADPDPEPAPDTVTA